ncbi:ABC transporter permease [Roseiflexus sp.]|uniref:ABC transporter permease n=1 Tax=Roseiflexus sp. TaxID=2562120 RepID=UPI002584753D|nr:ABC transporter permease [Roseiflexus sp.]
MTSTVPDRPTPHTLTTTHPADEVTRWLIRIRAYFLKEVREIRRQPLLLISLVAGPLLVLVIFGAGFVNSNPVLRTALILPDDLPVELRTQITGLVGLNFRLVNRAYTPVEARAALANGDLDVVQIVPDNVFGKLQRGENPTILIYSNAINPLVEGWIQYLAYAQVNEINKALLTEQTRLAQQQARAVGVRIAVGAERLTNLEREVSRAEQEAIRQELRTLRALIVQFRDTIPPESLFAGRGDDVEQLRARANEAIRSLDEVEAILSSGDFERGLDELRDSRELLLLLDQQIAIFVSIAPETIVSPVQQRYQNIRTEAIGQASGAYPAVVYYAPGVLALLVQHTAVSLGALALVRERMMGAFELFRVSPANMVQLLIGKYLGYTVVIAVASAALAAAMRLLGVPLNGSWLLFILLLLMLTIASLGVGFLISTVAGSDSQAIQFAMISLLLSIFFSGFFISRDSFAAWVEPIIVIIPMSHGVVGFQDLMLRGITPEPAVWIDLGVIAIVTFGLVTFLTQRQFRRA